MQLYTSWSIRPNPEDQINRKLNDRKNDQMTEKPLPNRFRHPTDQSGLMPILTLLLNSVIRFLFIRSSGFGPMGSPIIQRSFQFYVTALEKPTAVECAMAAHSKKGNYCIAL